MMKHAYISTLLVALAALPAFAANVASDWSRQTDFQAYGTFSFRAGTPIPFAKAQAQIDQALEKVLVEKGLSHGEGETDLVVVTHSRIDSENPVYVNSLGYAGVRWKGWQAWGPTMINISDVPVGAMLVDLLDGESGDLVWRSIIREVLPKKPQKGVKVGRALSKAFKQYPPGRE